MPISGTLSVTSPSGVLQCFMELLGEKYRLMVIIQCVFWLFKPLEITLHTNTCLPWDCAIALPYSFVLQTLLSILMLFHIWKMHVWKVRFDSFDVTLLIVKKTCHTSLKINTVDHSPKAHHGLFCQYNRFTELRYEIGTINRSV